MKKVLLFAMSVAIAFSINAQNKKAPKLVKVSGIEKNKVNKPFNFVDNQTQFETTFNGTTTLMPVTKDVNAINKVLISHSANFLSYYSAVTGQQQSVISSNSDLNLITFTARKSLTNIIPGTTVNVSGAIQTSFSIDGGLNWDTTLVAWRGAANAANAGRYPSGVIYNPTGNTTLANAYAVICGPKLNAAANLWVGNYFASESFAKTNNNTQTGNGPQDTTFATDYLTSCDGGTFHVMANHNIINTAQTAYSSVTAYRYDGSWNGTTNSVDWTTTSHNPPFSTDLNGDLNGNGEPAYAWSKDGQTGYIVYIGASNSAADPLAMAPIVYKSTDAGATWSVMAAFDYSTIPAINSSLVETSTPGVKRAFFSDPMDATVDANNNLHLAAFIKSASSNSVDSIGWSYTWSTIEGYMFDVFTTTAIGDWDANYIDTQYGQYVSDANSSWALRMDNRFTISKSPDGTKLFFSWLDSDTLNIVTDNLNKVPDVISLGYDVNTHYWTNAGIATNWTKGTIYDGDNFYLNAGDWSFKSGNNYTLHLSTMKMPGTDNTQPVDHYYLTGAVFSEADFLPVGVSEVSNEITSISQNYPNPANGTTTIDVNLAKSAKLGMVVTNLIGQKVYEVAANTVDAGTHTLSIDASKLSSGVYFYTVTADNNSITKKMIVE
jgi:hypothetical protein